MRTLLMVFLGALLLSAITSGSALAQLPENHYKVYEVPEEFPVPGPVFLTDQFTQFEFPEIFLDKFATPVMKNGEPMFDEAIHQTWYRIEEQIEGRIVELFNQFGGQRWVVRDAHYLVVPAAKNDPVALPPSNHYKCYDAEGPPVGLEVELVDQFGSTLVVVAEPVLFCNPVEKRYQGAVFPIVEPITHLACYRIEPPQAWGIPILAFDQFGDWQLTLDQELWLCVPSEKMRVIGVERSSWSEIKALYEN